MPVIRKERVKRIDKKSKTEIDKAKRKRLETELDNQWREIAMVKWGGKCCWPGCSQTSRLSVHHFFHKKQGHVARWHLDNGMPLCFGHHIRQVHGSGNVEPIREALIEKKGVDVFNALKAAVRVTWKPSIEDMEALRDVFSVQLSGK
jgi:hypothetical protein